MGTGHDVEQGALSSLLLRHQCADRRLRIAYGRRAGIDAVGACALAHLLTRDLTAAALARRVGVGLAEVAAALEALEQDGYVCRRQVGDGLLPPTFAPTPLGVATLRPPALADAAPDLDDGSAGRFLRRVAIAVEREADALADRDLGRG